MIIKYIISIHAPLTGSDLEIVYASQIADISIHAPLTGSDCCKHEKRHGSIYFNPRSPHRERHAVLSASDMEYFISIHAPLTGSDILYKHKFIT